MAETSPRRGGEGEGVGAMQKTFPEPRPAPFSATTVARRGLFRAHDEVEANSSWLPNLFLRLRN